MFVFTIGDVVGLAIWGIVIVGGILLWGIGKVQKYIESKRK